MNFMILPKLVHWNPNESVDELTDSISPLLSSNEEERVGNKGAAPQNKGASSSNKGGPSPLENIPMVTQSQLQDDKGDSSIDLQMPEMINIETVGLRQSPHIAAQQKSNGMSFTSILTKLCGLGVVLAAVLSPAVVFTDAQVAVNGIIHKCNVVNANFD